MRFVYSFNAVVLLVMGLFLWFYFGIERSQPAVDNSAMMNGQTSMSDRFTLTSEAFGSGDSIPPSFTCDGDNTSPSLSWSGVPAEAKSLALIVDDPDVPKQLKPDGVFDHWTLFNIPPNSTGLPSGGELGVAGANSSGRSQYIGPCPPKEYEPSEHRYFFRLYALDTELPLQAGASKKQVLDAMQGHVLGEAELLGKYKRL